MLAASMIVVTQYSPPTGDPIELNDDSVADLRMLSGITRKPTNDLAATAIEQLRNTLVPSTKATKAPSVRGPKVPKA